MDILTYALIRSGSGGNGALTGLSTVSINNDRQLVFTLSDGTEVTSQDPIPAASESTIIDAITNNKVSVQQALDIPAALTETITSMKAITDVAVTSVAIPGVNGEDGLPVIFTVNNHELQLPLAGDGTIGLVKGASVSDPDDLDNIETENINKIYINDDGTMSIYALSVDRLYVDPEDDFVFGGQGADID